MSPVVPRHIPGTPEWLVWSYPWVLALLAVLPLLWWLWGRAERRPALRYSSLAPLREAGGTAARRARAVLPILRTLALACLIVAAARPQRPDETRRVFAEGVAIELVVDVSGSMEDSDLSPSPRRLMSRLDVVKEVVRDFVKGNEEAGLGGRANDLIGMIRFARYPDAVCPLTLDHDTLLKILAQQQIVRRREENATAIGDALALAVERLREVRRTTGSGAEVNVKSRVVILLTDGENNEGLITPQQAGELAALHGIKVYTILAGTGYNAGYFRQRVDDRDLRFIAEVSGGRFFEARDRAALEQVYGEIDQLERTEVEERTNLRYGELSHWWLVAAFALLGMQMLLDATRMRKIP